MSVDVFPITPIPPASSGGGEGGVTVHNQLTGRSTANGHPISAITNLQAALDAFDAAIGGLDDGLADHIAGTDPHGDRAYAAALVDDLSGVTNAATARSNLGLGTAATQASTAFDAAGAASAAQSAAIAAAAALVDDLSGVSDAATARSNLGLGSLATASTVGSAQITDGAVAPGDLSASARRRVFTLLCTAPSAATAMVTGDGGGTGGGITAGDLVFPVPAEINGWNIVAVAATVTTVSSSGTPTIQIARDRGGSVVDVLSTRITIDANEKSSYTAATPAVINTSNDDVATGDFWRIDLDAVGTGTKGLAVIISVEP